MTIFAGIVLTAFGACGAWFLSKRFPQALFLRTGYAMMALGGVTCIAWSLSKVLVLGIAAIALILFGGLAGVVGALRKELRALT